MKDIFKLAFTMCAGVISTVIGGFDYLIYVLVLIMISDYVSGLLVAGLFNKSPKSPNGGLDSRAGFKGLIKKCMILLCVAIAAGVDRVLGNALFRNMVIIGFIVNELISFLENLSLMGVHYPAAMEKMLDVLNERSNENGVSEVQGKLAESSNQSREGGRDNN